MTDNSIEVQKQRDFGYDFIRFIAIFLIIIGHFSATCIINDYRFPDLVEKIVLTHGSLGFGGIGVAFFFMLSGAVLVMKHQITPPQQPFSIVQDITSFYKKRLLRIEIL